MADRYQENPRAAGWFRRLLAALPVSAHGSSSSALLNAKDLLAIRALALAPNTRLPITRHESRELLGGERLAAFTGSGIEFTEHRAYQYGDNPRFINWRLYGRTRQLFVRRFQEERREQVFMLVDRREGMWFGTRRRLKVARAVAQAVFLAQLAERQQFAVSAAILEEPAPLWFESQRGAFEGTPLFTHLLKMRQPAQIRPSVACLNETLAQLPLRIPAGSLLCLISDFRDLDPESVPLLYALAREHTVLAFHTRDPVEWELPPRGRYLVGDPAHADQLRLLDCGDPHARASLQAELASRQAAIRDMLTRGGAEYVACATTDAWTALSGFARRGA